MSPSCLTFQINSSWDTLLTNFLKFRWNGPIFNLAPSLHIEITLSSGTNIAISKQSKFFTKGFSILFALSILIAVMYFIYSWCFVNFLIVLRALIALLSSLLQWGFLLQHFYSPQGKHGLWDITGPLFLRMKKSLKDINFISQQHLIYHGPSLSS